MRFSPKAGIAVGLILAGVACGLVYGFARDLPVAPAPVAAQNDDPKKADPKPGPDEADVHKALEGFVDAFNENDAAKCAAAFAPTAEFIDDDSNRLEGSKQIGEVLTKYFATNKGAKLQITPEGTRTVAPGVVIEDGESVVTVPDKQTQSVRKFTFVYAKIGGAWKIASMREYPEEPEVVATEDRLKELEFFIGEWVDEGGDSLVATTVKWSPDKSCLVREFSVLQQGKELMTGMQRIAVDPLTGTVKGWSFDSEGGHGESTWTKNGDSWLIRGTGVTSDGDTAAATYVIKPLSKDRVELKTMHKVVGDTVEADATSILVRRVVVRDPKPEKK
jgi:uncharacterized protein (TIGR02246 family)